MDHYFVSWHGESAPNAFQGLELAESPDELAVERATRFALFSQALAASRRMRFVAWHPTPPDRRVWAGTLKRAGAQVNASRDTASGVLSVEAIDALLAADFLRIEIRLPSGELVLESADDAKQFWVRGERRS